MVIGDAATIWLSLRGAIQPWALPAPSVKQRYLAQGVEWLSTAEAGQVSLRIAGRDIDVVRYRQDKRAAWYRPQRCQRVRHGWRG